MSSASAIGLLSLFTVDLLDMYFLSLLGEPEIVAAVGFSSTLMFLLFSSCIGMQIGMGALVARAEGEMQRELAGRYCTNVWIFSFSLILCLSALVYAFLPELLQFIGAKGKTLDYALSYSYIMLPSLLLVSISMCAGAALRAIGDAKRSMFTTLSGGVANAILDPIFIFGFAWGIEGAAWASVSARLAVFCLGLYFVFVHHKLPQPTSWALFKEDLPKISKVALPAMLTNVMTPLGGALVLKLVAVYGAAAVAAYAVLGRIVPVAFGALFSLSGAIGPIIGQNAGANQYARVRDALIKSAQVIVVYVLFIWVLLFSAQELIISVFDVQAEGKTVFYTYCTYLVGFFTFAGLLFVANAAFNNLHKAHWSFVFNFSRTFLGTVPFAYLFSHYFGLVGLMFGDVSGAMVFGCVAFFLALSLVNKLEKQASAGSQA
jgi:putative MATE family efflux protein